MPAVVDAAVALSLDVGLVTHNPSDYAGVDGLCIITEAPMNRG